MCNYYKCLLSVHGQNFSTVRRIAQRLCARMGGGNPTRLREKKAKVTKKHARLIFTKCR